MGSVSLRLPASGQPMVAAALSPYLSTLANVLDVVGGMGRGIPVEWQRRIAGAIGDTGWSAIRPMAEHRLVPDCLSPAHLPGDSIIDNDVDEVRSRGTDDVAGSIESEFGERLPSTWQQACARPGRWADECLSAVEAAASSTAPVWERARPLLDREVERIGVASVRRSVPALLATLNSRIHYHDGVLTFDHPDPGDHHLGTRELILVPMITGSRMIMMSNFAVDKEAIIGYPVPGMATVWSGAGDAGPKDGLGELLGPIRATIIRSLGAPTTTAALSVLTSRSPSTITAQCDRLESAGLIVRSRRGRSMYVEITAIGRKVRDAYESGPA